MAEFKEFCRKTDYIELKGKSANSLSIDRKKSWLGYDFDNIQVLTLSENSRKEHVSQRIEEDEDPF
jgi:hypothetical protein